MTVMGSVINAMMTLITTGSLMMKITVFTSLTHVRKITIITVNCREVPSEIVRL